MTSARSGSAGPDAPAAPAGDGGVPSPSRRRLLAGAGLAGAGVAAGGLAGFFGERAAASGSATGGTADASQTVPFYGAHQAGIATPAQDRLAFGTLNVVPGASRADLRDLLRQWTRGGGADDGGPAGGRSDRAVARRRSTPARRWARRCPGSPSRSGTGPSLFDDRFGLAARRPAALADAAAAAEREPRPRSSGGDLCVQACSDDPLVAFHAVRNLARIGMGVVAHNWLELGFGRTSTTSTAQQTPRNLLGFKDGTRNIKAEQGGLMDAYVWVGQEADQPWLRGGSYLVARKIQMLIENWDRDYLRDQENVIGRSKSSGAPLSGGTEFTEPDFAAADGRAAGHSRRLARPAGQPRAQRRDPDPAPRLLLHRRHRPADGDAARRPVLHRVHEASRPVHQAADCPGGRRAQRVRPPHGQRRLRLPAGGFSRRALG